MVEMVAGANDVKGITQCTAFQLAAAAAAALLSESLL
jgi:hypothetical protein